MRRPAGLQAGRRVLFLLERHMARTAVDPIRSPRPPLCRRRRPSSGSSGYRASMSGHDHIMEKEANEFAMRLLVPTALLLKDMKGGIDLADDRAVEALAHRYRVPVAVMVLRIQQVSKEHKL